jgi:Pentapeptide repeats (8 copies)
MMPLAPSIDQDMAAVQGRAACLTDMEHRLAHHFERAEPRQRVPGEVRREVLDVVARLGAEVAMIDIRHRETGALLLQINAETMAGIQLSDQVLRGADLRGADLCGAQLRRAYVIDVDLREANLENARLNGADLTDVLLSGANLRGAHFNEAKVRSVDFRHADLSGAAFHNAFVVTSAFDDATLTAANLHRATLIATSLVGGSLSEVDLTGALLSGVNLTGTNLSGACFAETFIADCRTLHAALGLSAIKHLAPSSLDVRALRACAARLPDAFLRSIGYTPEEIDHLKTQYTHSHL